MDVDAAGLADDAAAVDIRGDGDLQETNPGADELT